MQTLCKVAPEEVGIEYSGSQAGFRAVYESTCKGGDLRLVGAPAQPINVDFTFWLQKSPRMVNIHSWRIGDTWVVSTALVYEKKVDLSPIASHVLPLAEAQRGFEMILRGDDRDHTLVYYEGDPSETTAAFEVATARELDAAGAILDELKLGARRGRREEAEQRRVEDFIALRDPSGNNIELVLRPQHSGRRYFAGRDAGITSFSHIGLRTTDPVRDEVFWTEVCNARVSDRIGAAPLLRIDEVHHKIALFPSTFPGVQHVNHQVAGVDDVMRAWYFLLEQGVKIVFGPGRHPTSTAMFLYFEGPDGMVYEYSTGVRLIKPEEEATYKPRQFPFDASSFCMWGSKPDIPEFRS